MTPDQIEARKEKARQRARAWYEANKARAHANSSAWAAANPERRENIKTRSAEKLKAETKRRKAELYASSDKTVQKAKRARYYVENKAQLSQSVKRWRAENPEKIKAIKRNAYKRNKAAWIGYAHSRRARKLANGGVLSRGIIMKLWSAQQGKCAYCKACLTKTKKHLDHILPLALGGRNDDANVQLLCAPCNLKKGAMHPVDFMRLYGFSV